MKFNYKNILILGLVLAWVFNASAQHVELRGSLEDAKGEKLSSATAILLNAADSLLISFATTDDKGAFVIKKVKPGSYILQLSYLGFQARHLHLDLDGSQEVHAIGVIVMEERTTNLSEVEVLADYAPMQVKKDTLEYNADAFRPKTHEVVEDLLKRLPGIEVDEEGNIKAQGEDVQQVLVDGKEFFGRDSKIATRNLPADAINKVQIFDKKSDMAEFSGIDDGEEEKTINLELKADRRRGVFGNMAAGYGTDDRYTANASINKFSASEQISLIGSVNNVNQQGFSFNDYASFMGGVENVFSGGRGRRGNQPINNGLSTGLVQSGAFGLNYNKDFGNKTKLRSSYFFNHLDQDIDRVSEIENTLGQIYYSDENLNSNTLNNNHRFNISLSHDVDSNQNIKLETSLSFSDGNYFSNSFEESYLPDLTPLNNLDRQNFSESDNLKTDIELMYRRKLGKPGRTMFVSGSYGFDDGDRVSGLESENGYFDMGVLTEIDSILQDQRLLQKDKQYRLRASYTEPLGKGKYLEAAIERRVIQNDLDKDVYDLDDDNGFFNPDLSQQYILEQTYDRAGLGFRLTKDLLYLSFGADVQRSMLEGEVMSSENKIEKEDYYLLPEMRIRYEFSPSARLMVDYRTRVNEPSITQLQPIIDNSNPFNIYVGNPDLKPEYSHSANLRFHSFSQFSQISLFGSLGYTYTKNNITNARTISPEFVKTSMPVNVERNTSTRGYFGIGLPLRFIKSRLSVNANASYSNGITFVDLIEDATRRWNTGVQLRLNNQSREILEWGLSARVSYNTTLYEEQSAENQDYFNQQYGIDMRVNFLKNWSVGGKLNYSIYTSSLDNQDLEVPLTEAFLSRDFMDKRLRISLAAFDLFNRNEGIQQNADLNYLEETRTRTLGRYFMLTARYALNKLGGDSGQRHFRH